MSAYICAQLQCHSTQKLRPSYLFSFFFLTGCRKVQKQLCFLKRTSPESGFTSCNNSGSFGEQLIEPFGTCEKLQQSWFYWQEFSVSSEYHDLSHGNRLVEEEVSVDTRGQERGPPWIIWHLWLFSIPLNFHYLLSFFYCYTQWLFPLCHKFEFSDIFINTTLYHIAFDTIDLYGLWWVNLPVEPLLWLCIWHRTYNL